MLKNFKIKIKYNLQYKLNQNRTFYINTNLTQLSQKATIKSSYKIVQKVKNQSIMIIIMILHHHRIILTLIINLLAIITIIRINLQQSLQLVSKIV